MHGARDIRQTLLEQQLISQGNAICSAPVFFLCSTHARAVDWTDTHTPMMNGYYMENQ
jgi:hypothetical protein